MKKLFLLAIALLGITVIHGEIKIYGQEQSISASVKGEEFGWCYYASYECKNSAVHAANYLRSCGYCTKIVDTGYCYKVYYQH